MTDPLDLVKETLAACAPERLVSLAADRLPAAAGRYWLLAAGKAAPGLARALQHHYGRAIDRTLVVAPTGLETQGLADATVLHAPHPEPDERSEAAARAALAMAAELPKDATLLFAISGGTSSLLALPAPGLTLTDKRAMTTLLLRSGAPIGRVNTVRRHLSAIKGGRLAEACGGRVVTLVLSDVVGDDLAAVGSGPTLPETTTAKEALAILEWYGLGDRTPANVRALLEREAAVQAPPGVTRPSSAILIAGPEALRHTAAQVAGAHGYDVHKEPLTPGRSLDVHALARRVVDLARRARPSARPLVFVGSGEPTVVVRRGGRGGRNAHLALLVAKELRGRHDLWFASVGSDGIDGSSGAAGALVSGDTWDAAARANLDGEQLLERFDSGLFHEQAGTAVVTGPTGTNLTDLHLLGVRPKS